MKDILMLIISEIRIRANGVFSPRMSEWFPTILLILCGIVLALNPTLMSNPDARVYDVLLSFMSQSAWSLTLMLFGVVRLSVLIINGAWVRSPYARALMAFISCFFWTQMTLSFFAVFGLGFAAFFVWLLVDMLNVMRTMKDAREVEDTIIRSADVGPD